jgi:hypothetical protein
MTPDPLPPTLAHLTPLEGEWRIEATHRLMPGVDIRGRATFESLDGGRILIWRASYDHPDIPDSIAVISCDETGDLRHPEGGCALHYFDQRGVTRLFHISAEAGTWRYWRDHPGFSQRFTGVFGPDDSTISGVVELNQDGTHWEEDLRLTYRRVEA